MSSRSGQDLNSLSDDGRNSSEIPVSRNVRFESQVASLGDSTWDSYSIYSLPTHKLSADPSNLIFGTGDFFPGSAIHPVNGGTVEEHWAMYAPAPDGKSIHQRPSLRFQYMYASFGASYHVRELSESLCHIVLDGHPISSHVRTKPAGICAGERAE